MRSNNKYGQVTIHPHAREMLHRISSVTYIHNNQLAGMYIANEACLLDSMGKHDYLELCCTKYDKVEETLAYFEPSDSEKHSGRLKIYHTYLAKLREIAWSINVRPQDYLTYVIGAEYESFVNLNRELSLDKYIARLGQYRNKMDEVFGSPTSCIYKVPREWESVFVPASKLKNQGGDSLL